MDYLEGKAQSSAGSASTPALARYERQSLLPTSDDCNLQCNDYEIESNNMNLSSRSAQGDGIPKVKIEPEGGGKKTENEISDESITQEDDEAEENSDEEADATELAKMSVKRRRYPSLRTTTKKAKGIIAYAIPELKMKADLLEEFGDLSMVEQLLEEIDGDVSPGGTRRLRRWRNSEGAIEYWVEDADLVNIRKEAGINDPFCVQPPGWRPLGRDCPTQQISVLKREVELIAQSLAFHLTGRIQERSKGSYGVLRYEIKKLFLLEKEDEKQGMQGVERKKEEEEGSSDAQYEARDNNYSSGYKTTIIMVHDLISGDNSRNKELKENQELPSKCCCTSDMSLSEGAGS